MNASHVFVTKGSLTNFACDAWLLPTDRTYSVSAYWQAADPEIRAAVDSSRSDAFSSGTQLALPLHGWPQSKPLPVLTAVPYYGLSSVEELLPALREFITVAAAESTRRRAVAREIAKAAAKETEEDPDTLRPVPLLAMPLFGTGGGGAGLVRGDVIRHLLQEARSAAEKAGVDVALVLAKEQDYAFAQELRKREDRPWWSSLTPELHSQAEGLAAHAQARKLVPFMGAGISMSAGAPSWKQLLEGLADDAGLPAEAKASLRNRSNLDQAGILRSIFEERAVQGGPSFNQAIADRVSLDRYGLAPALLASIGSREAITLNYDELFEQASADAGVSRNVIPDGSEENHAWLLKLHGSVRNPETIVLTRDDYLGFNTSRNALSALVKATLMTQHLLFVGFGLADDHFHEILHDVRRALPQGGQRQGFATALMLTTDPLDKRMWSHLNLVSMRGDTDASTADMARQLEIFLDLLAALSTDSHSYLLAPGYEGALSQGEKSLRAKLLELTRGLIPEEGESSGGIRVRDMLKELGAGDERLPCPPEPAAAPTLQVKEVAAGGTNMELFTEQDLRARGFLGFKRFRGLDLADVPRQPGVYAVLRSPDAPHPVLPVNVGGWFKGKDPTKAPSELQSRLQCSAQTLYVGKAGAGGKGNRGLQRRIGELAKFGLGQAIGHWGGRCLWQLENSQDLLIAWLPVEGRSPAEVEDELLEEFAQQFGQLPFANLRR